MQWNWNRFVTQSLRLYCQMKSHFIDRRLSKVPDWNRKLVGPRLTIALIVTGGQYWSFSANLSQKCCRQLPDFKAKIHQILLRLGLRVQPRPRWGNTQRSPFPLARFKGPILLRREDGRTKEVRKKGRTGEGERVRRRGGMRRKEGREG